MKQYMKAKGLFSMRITPGSDSSIKEGIAYCQFRGEHYLKRLVLSQLGTDGGGDQGEGSGDEDTWEYVTMNDIILNVILDITEHDEKEDICSITTIANKIS